MHRVGAYILGLLFSGGTILAAGSVLGSLKRSVSGPLMPTCPAVRMAAQRKLPAEPESAVQDGEIPEPAVLAHPAPQLQPAETSDHPSPHATDTSRAGKKTKKVRRAEPRKRAQAKEQSGSAAAATKKEPEPGLVIYDTSQPRHGRAVVPSMNIALDGGRHVEVVSMRIAAFYQIALPVALILLERLPVLGNRDRAYVLQQVRQAES